MRYVVHEDQAGKRLDVFVAAALPRLSRAYVQKMCEEGRITIGDKPCRAGQKVRTSETITVDYDERELDTIPDIDLPILYEDNDCVVINKPAGVLTHAQGAFQPEATVATFLRNRITDIAGERAGIVHRLDRATSGVIVGAKNQTALSFLQKQFAQRKVKKTYVAIVSGHLKVPEGIIDMPIERNPKAPATFRVGANGKPAVTHFKVLQTNDHYSLIELSPETGRTHQLRVHLQKLGHPIVGDPLYGAGKYGDRLYLHALQLEITLPDRERRTFMAPLPPEFKDFLHA